MTYLLRAAALALVVAGPQVVATGYAAEPFGPSVAIRDLSDVDVSVGQGDVALPAINFTTAPGLRLFTQPVNAGTIARDGLSSGDRSALKREFSFVDQADEAGLLELVAAIRNDPDQPPQGGDTGAAVNEWTTMLDNKDAGAALAPPSSGQVSPDNAPSGGMGPQTLP